MFVFEYKSKQFFTKIHTEKKKENKSKKIAKQNNKKDILETSSHPFLPGKHSM